MTCIHCDSELPRGAMFCGECGQSTAAASSSRARIAGVPRTSDPIQAAPPEPASGNATPSSVTPDRQSAPPADAPAAGPRRFESPLVGPPAAPVATFIDEPVGAVADSGGRDTPVGGEPSRGLVSDAPNDAPSETPGDETGESPGETPGELPTDAPGEARSSALRAHGRRAAGPVPAVPDLPTQPTESMPGLGPDHGGDSRPPIGPDHLDHPADSAPASLGSFIETSLERSLEPGAAPSPAAERAMGGDRAVADAIARAIGRDGSLVTPPPTAPTHPASPVPAAQRESAAPESGRAAVPNTPPVGVSAAPPGVPTPPGDSALSGVSAAAGVAVPAAAEETSPVSAANRPEVCEQCGAELSRHDIF